ncbi:MAG: FtsQ-type POTRA domain-containing protein [Longimicrobiales bacterium]|nr:FtsQ-type POTRA domain-containing protein [Longimicrobiales bacterium]
MRSEGKVLLATLALGPVLLWGPQVTDALSRMETFEVDDVQVQGARFLAEDTVVARLALSGRASVWGDTEVLRERVEAHPLVQRAEIRRRLPDGLVVAVQERTPVALAGTPVLEPVDREGRRLPIDPSRHALDLPILAIEAAPPAGASVFPEEVRALAAQVEHLRRVDEELVRRISTLALRNDGALELHLVSPDVTLLVEPDVSVARLREAEAALTDAISRTPGRIPTVVDLRFADQVVVRRSPRE